MTMYISVACTADIAEYYWVRPEPIVLLIFFPYSIPEFSQIVP